MHSSKVVLKQKVKIETEVDVEVQPYDFGKLMSPEQFALLLTGRCNSFYTEYKSGREVGKFIQSEHPTLQATVFRYLLGVVVGLSDGVSYTDARNKIAVETSREIGEKIEKGEISIGYMI